MKKYIKTGWLIAYTLICTCVILSCSQKKDKQEQLPSLAENKEADQTICICFDGEIQFRRSYAGIQYIHDEKEVARYMDEQEKSNPILVAGEKNPLIKHFERSGLVREREVLIDKFNFSTKTEFQFPNDLGENIRIRFAKDTITGRNSLLRAFQGSDSTEMKISDLMQWQYQLLDVIPGGNKEIVVLDEHYFMNGYNFDFKVYEITFPKRTL